MQPRQDRFTFVELFAGVGGFRLGLEAAGGVCLLACEYCRFAATTYRKNWPGAHCVGDIHRIAGSQVPRADVFAAGFPCQSFSNAGRLGGLADPRGQLFHEMVRLIRACQPRAILLENVQGLLTHAESLQAVLSSLAEAGFPDMAVSLLDASCLVPQRRKRAFLVGFRDASAREAFDWPALPVLRRTADEILEYRFGAPAPLAAGLALPHDKWRRVSESNYFQAWPGARLLPPGALAQTLQATYKSGYLLYSQFVPQHPLDWSKMPLPMAADGGTIARFYSARECARLMGFPESFELPQVPEGIAHRQMGNAVCPPLVGAIGVAIVRALERASELPDGDCLGADDGTEHRAASQCEAMAVALSLSCAACPVERQPRLCWLPSMASASLGEELPAVLEDSSTSDASTIRVRGASYHEELPDTVSWSGPYLVAAVLDVVQRRGLARSSSRPLLRQQGKQPEQTMPLPTHAIKTEVAARCMRNFLVASRLRNVEL